MCERWPRIPNRSVAFSARPPKTPNNAWIDKGKPKVLQLYLRTSAKSNSNRLSPEDTKIEIDELPRSGAVSDYLKHQILRAQHTPKMRTALQALFSSFWATFIRRCVYIFVHICTYAAHRFVSDGRREQTVLHRPCTLCSPSPFATFTLLCTSPHYAFLCLIERQFTHRHAPCKTFAKKNARKTAWALHPVTQVPKRTDPKSAVFARNCS